MRRPSIADVLLETPPGHRRDPARHGQSRTFTSSPARRALASMDDALKNVRQPERRLADVIRPLRADFDVDRPRLARRVFARWRWACRSRPTTWSCRSGPTTCRSNRWLICCAGIAIVTRRARRRRALRGIVLTMVDHRRQATREIVQIIRAHNPRGVFRTEIPEDPRAAEAPSHGMPLVGYARSQRGARVHRRSPASCLHASSVRAAESACGVRLHLLYDWGRSLSRAEELTT